MKKMKALSIRQPYAEQIMRGKKKIEYRSISTNKRERVYIYASKQPADGFEKSDLPTAVLVGTVEIIGCVKKGERDYHWCLANPARLKRSVKPKNHPQPVWFNPF